MGRYIDRQGGTSKASATPYTAPSSTSERISNAQGRNMRRTLGVEEYSPYQNVRGRYRRYKDEEEKFLNSPEGQKLQEEIQKQIEEAQQKEVERLTAVQERAQRQSDAYLEATEYERKALASTSTMQEDLIGLGYGEEEAQQYQGLDPDALALFRENQDEFYNQYTDVQRLRRPTFKEAAKAVPGQMWDSFAEFWWRPQEVKPPAFFMTDEQTAQMHERANTKVYGKWMSIPTNLASSVVEYTAEGIVKAAYLIGSEAYLMGKEDTMEKQLGRKLTDEEKEELVKLKIPWQLEERINIDPLLGPDEDEAELRRFVTRYKNHLDHENEENPDDPIINQIKVFWHQAGEPILDLWIASDLLKMATRPLVYKVVGKEAGTTGMKEVTKGGKKVFVPRNPKEAARLAIKSKETELGRKLTKAEKAEIYHKYATTVVTRTEGAMLQEAYQIMGLNAKDIASLGKMTEEEASVLFAQRLRERATAIIGNKGGLGIAGETAIRPMATPMELMQSLNAMKAEGLLTDAQVKELVRLNDAVMTVFGIQLKQGIVGIPRLVQIGREFAEAINKPIRSIDDLTTSMERILRGRARAAGEGVISLGLSIDDVSKGYTKGGRAKGKLTNTEDARRAGQFAEDAKKAGGGDIRYGYDPRNNSIQVHWADRAKFEALAPEQRAAILTAAKAAEVNFGIMWEPEPGVIPAVDEVDILAGGFSRADIEVNKLVRQSEEAISAQKKEIATADDAFVKDGLSPDDPLVRELEASGVNQAALIDTLKNIQNISTGRSVPELISKQLLNTPFRAGITEAPRLSKANINEASPIQKAILESNNELIARMADAARGVRGPAEFSRLYSFLMSAAERARVPYRGTGIFSEVGTAKERLAELFLEDPTGIGREQIRQVIRTELPAELIDMMPALREPLLAYVAKDVPLSKFKNLMKPGTDGDKVRELVYQRSEALQLITEGQINNPTTVLSKLRRQDPKPNVPIFMLTPAGRAVLLTPSTGVAQTIAAAKMGGVNTIPGYVVDITGDLKDFRKLLSSNNMTLADFAREVRSMEPKVTKARPAKAPTAKESREKAGLLTGDLTRVGTSLENSVVIPTKYMRTELPANEPILYNGMIARDQFDIPKLVKVGEGSSRVVFEVGPDAMLKIAKTELGKVQNLMSYNSHAWSNGLIPNQLAGGDNWILVERYKPMEGEAHKHFQTFIDAWRVYAKRVIPNIKNDQVQSMVADWARGQHMTFMSEEFGIIKQKFDVMEFDKVMFDFLNEWRQSDEALLAVTKDGNPIYKWDEFAHYNVNLDILKEDSWGMRPDGTLVLIDEGSIYREAISLLRSDGTTWRKFYTNFDDGVNKSKAAKDKYSDYDGHRNFGFTPVPAIDGDEDDGTYQDDIWRSLLFSAMASVSRGKGGKGKPQKKKATEIDKVRNDVLPKNTPKPTGALPKATLNADIYKAQTSEPFGGVFPQAKGHQGNTPVGIPSFDRDGKLLQPLGKGGYAFLDADVAATYNKKRATESYVSNMDNPLVLNTDDELRKLTKDAGLDNLDIDTGFYTKTEANIAKLRKYIETTLGHDGVIVAMDPRKGRIDLLDRYFQYNQVINFGKNFKKAQGPNVPKTTVTKKTRSKKAQRQIMRLVDPPKSTVTMTEERLLRDRLRTLNIAIKEGRKLGVLEARKSVSARLHNMYEIKLAQAQRNTYLRRLQDRIVMREKQLVKEELVQYAEKMLSTKVSREFLAERGKLMKTIKNVNTRRELLKALATVDRLHGKMHRKLLTQRLVKAVDKIVSGKTVSADYRKLVRDAMKDIDVVNRRPSTIKKIAAMRDWVDAQRAAGIDVLVTDDMLRQLEILGQKGIEHMSLGEIHALIKNIETLGELGKAKRQSYLELQRLRKEKQLKEILEADIRKIDKAEISNTPANVEQSLSPSRPEAFKNWWKDKVLNNYRETKSSIMPMDYFFDYLDGGLGFFDGTMQQIFRDNVNLKFTNFLKDYQKFQDDMNALIVKNKLRRGNGERITVYMQARRPEGRERLISMGITDDIIDSVKMTKNEMEVVKFFDDFLNEERPWLAKIARDIFNKEFKVLEDMFPMIADFKAAGEANLRIEDMFGDTLPKVGTPEARASKRTKVKEGTIKSRKPGAKMPIQINAFETMQQHAENTFYMRHMAETIKTLGDIKNASRMKNVGGKQVRVNLLQEKVGDVAYDVINGYVDLLARKGGAEGQRQIAGLSMLNRNVGPAVLAWKLASMLIQPTAINNTAAALKNARPYWEMIDTLADPRARKYVIEHFPEIRARVGDDIAFLDKADWRLLERWNKAGWYGLQKLDQWTAAAGALAAYKTELAKKGIKFSYNTVDKAAVQRAQTIVRATQSSSLWKDAPPALSSGYGLTGNRELNRLLLKFQSFGLADFHTIKTYVFSQGFRGEDLKTRASVIWSFFAIMMGTLMTVAIRRATWYGEDYVFGRDPDEDRRLSEGIEQQMMLEITQKVPFMSQGISMAVYDSEPVPALNSMAKAIYGSYRVGQTLMNEDGNPASTAKGTVDALQGFGSMGGVGGTGQVASWAKAYIDGMDGKGNDANYNPMGTPMMAPGVMSQPMPGGTMNQPMP